MAFNRVNSYQRKHNHEKTSGEEEWKNLIGALQTSGPVAAISGHRKVQAKKLKRPAHPDELFIARHKRKNGDWVDLCAAKTHEEYLDSLTHATKNNDNVDGSTRLQLWKEAARGKSRGQCYGAAQLAANTKYGVSSLTHVSTTNHNREVESQAIEAARAEVTAAREEVARANARIEELAKQFEDFKKEMLAKQFEDFKKEMLAMVRSGHAGPSTAPSSYHVDYDEIDDEWEDGDENE